MPRLFALLAAFGLLAFPPSVPSADKKAPPAKTKPAPKIEKTAKVVPTLTIRIQPIDTLIANVKQLAILFGKAEEAKQLDGFARAKIGDTGLEGIDVKRPLGFYSILSAQVVSSPTFAVIPIASEKDFLDLLQNFNMPATKGDDGIYSFAHEKLPVSFYFKFAHKYAYLTAPEKSSLDAANLIAPAELFGAQESGTVAADWRLDKVPDELKQIALNYLDLRFVDLQDRKEPGETEAQRKLRIQGLKDLSAFVAAVINDGSQAALKLNLDAKDEVTADFALGAKPKTALATSIASWGVRPSRFATLARPGAALSVSGHVRLSPEVQAALGPVIDEGIQKALQAEDDEAKRKTSAAFLDALKPALKAGELDGGFRLDRSAASKHFTLTLGLKLKDGAKILAAVRDLEKTFPKTERVMIHLDDVKTDSGPIHRIDAQKSFNEDAKRILGEHPLYFAVLDDAFLLSGGPNGLDALTALITAKATPAPLFHFEMALARLAPTLGQASASDRKALVKTAQDVFGTEADNDRVVFTVQGGKALHAHFAMKAQVVRFLAEVEKLTKKTTTDE